MRKVESESKGEHKVGSETKAKEWHRLTCEFGLWKPHPGSGIEDPDPDQGLYPLQNPWVYPDPCNTLGLLKIHVPQGYPCPSLTVASSSLQSLLFSLLLPENLAHNLICIFDAVLTGFEAMLTFSKCMWSWVWCYFRQVH